LFCIAKEPVLLGKSAYIAAQNNRFCKTKQFGSLSGCTFFTKWKSFLGFTLGPLPQSVRLISTPQLHLFNKAKKTL